jgi:hypothetical protein
VQTGIQTSQMKGLRKAYIPWKHLTCKASWSRLDWSWRTLDSLKSSWDQIFLVGFLPGLFCFLNVDPRNDNQSLKLGAYNCELRSGLKLRLLLTFDPWQGATSVTLDMKGKHRGMQEHWDQSEWSKYQPLPDSRSKNKWPWSQHIVDHSWSLMQPS